MRNKAGLLGLLLILILMVWHSISFAAEVFTTKSIPVTYRGIKIIVNGKQIPGEEPLVLDNKGIIMVPVRTVAEATGKQVVWDEKVNTIYIGNLSSQAQTPKSSAKTGTPQPKQGQIIPVTYRNIRIMAGGKIISGEEPFIMDRTGTVMVPVRTVSEALGKSVVWDPKKNTLTISAGGVASTSAGVAQDKTASFSRLEDMMVLRNVGPFFRQTDKPFMIAAGAHSHGLGVRLTGGHAEVVIRTNGKYKAIEGWLGVDDETKNSNGAFFFSIQTDNKEVPSFYEINGGAEKIKGNVPDFTLEEPKDLNGPIDEEADEEEDIHKVTYPVNTDLLEKTPVFVSGPILPASYPRYISPTVTDISGALTVTLTVTWVAGSEGDYPDLTAVLADFKFIKQ
ncbi:stalk domain-containing protein [Candidatus Formimonas warabiya]|uniref:Copper amine oxidase N-terminal domain-containing protein n=1 Tax=Formimonas warabiya TaxID=1761012 RepID=A0A3G1KND2_FORW1|nr:stalk domain-containing protein [Candidatus Formimonas warabiya]ATW24001.1 hypothetical protein DCMF_03625 [Candidatus Formimonas warabiya]